jgi:hypothetical protein
MHMLGLERALVTSLDYVTARFGMAASAVTPGDAQDDEGATSALPGAALSSIARDRHGD